MRGWTIACLLAALAATAPTLAQTTAPTSADPGPAYSCLDENRGALGASPLLNITLGTAKAEPQGTPADAGPPVPLARPNGWYVRARNLVGVSGRYVDVVLVRPRTGTQSPWDEIELIAAARPAAAATNRFPEAVYARFLRDDAGRVIEEGGMAVVRIEMPPIGSFLEVSGAARLREHWTYVLALCNREKTTMLGWASHEGATGAPWLIAGATAAVLALLLVLALRAAVAAHRQALIAAWRDRAGEGGPAEPPRRWSMLRMLHPAALSMTAEGDASLGRFQVLVFTFTVVGALLVVFFSTFAIPVLSTDILALLGITALGSFGARVAANSGSVTTTNTSWLAAKGIVAPRRGLPRMTDLVIADGEVDLTRVQALFFTLLVCSSLVFSGTADLAGFTVPAQTMQLLGLSQLTYVAGKAIPAESVRRLNAEIDALRTAERLLIEAAARGEATRAATDLDPAARLAGEAAAREAQAQAQSRWTDARAAAATTLESVYGLRFRGERLNALAPG